MNNPSLASFTLLSANLKRNDHIYPLLAPLEKALKLDSIESKLTVCVLKLIHPSLSPSHTHTHTHTLSTLLLIIYSLFYLYLNNLPFLFFFTHPHHSYSDIWSIHSRCIHWIHSASLSHARLTPTGLNKTTQS